MFQSPFTIRIFAQCSLVTILSIGIFVNVPRLLFAIRPYANVHKLFAMMPFVKCSRRTICYQDICQLSQGHCFAIRIFAKYSRITLQSKPLSNVPGPLLPSGHLPMCLGQCLPSGYLSNDSVSLFVIRTFANCTRVTVCH